MPRLREAATAVSNAGNWRDYVRLIRAPNVFTALADVALGYLITHEELALSGSVVALLAASGCLYLAGMTLNDVFDRDIDAVERPERPIPSGRIPRRNAQRLGWGLLATGVLASGVATLLSGGGQLLPGPLGIAAALAALVVGYNAFLKRTFLGPIAMGGCRTLNVMLGMSAAALDGWHAMHLAVAVGLGTYVAGLTWFARDEAIVSRRWQLALAAAVMCGAVASLAGYPRWADVNLPENLAPAYATADAWRWNALWLTSAALIGHRLLRAILSPSPRLVMAAVKSSILSIIVLDAICCLGVRGVGGAVLILLLLAPALWLGRWAYST